MRKFISKIIFSAIAMCVITLTACQEWLNTSPPTEIREEQMFETVEGFQQALYGCYISMTNGKNALSPGLYSELLTWRIPEILAHQYSSNERSDDIGFYNYTFTSSMTKKNIQSIWESAYNTIANANNALTYIDLNSKVLDPINYNIIKGELLTMRAFLHFDLLRLFGVSNLAERTDKNTKLTIPYVIKVSKTIADQNTYAQVIEFLINDITEAIALLKDIDPITNTHPSSYYDAVNEDKFFDNRQTRFNYYSAKTLLARVYMWEGSQESIEKARMLTIETITELETNPNISFVSTSAVASVDPILSSEHIFALDVINLWKRTADFFQASPKATDYEALYITNTRANEMFEVPTTDYRYTSQLYYYAGLEGGVYISRKYLLSVSVNPNTGDVHTTHYNIPLMRLPELYYMAAECYVRQSTPDYINALRYLNHIRSLRGLTQELSGINDPLFIMEEIKKEYSKEFFAEGQMFYYYKRMGEVSIPNYSEDMDDTKYMLPYPDIEIQFGRIQ